ncbi:telomeric repeat-binding factor 1-like [Lethenteron reissneri]|uniref:telomeric repeat-binding factor 1-like n=1 Tax=Lethenteron reissneri TaxID=7753 RepID=UPI002AB6B6B0|nr:telomeric repeat-binding factor 1-like [Lethenteron reissneri]
MAKRGKTSTAAAAAKLTGVEAVRTQPEEDKKEKQEEAMLEEGHEERQEKREEKGGEEEEKGGEAVNVEEDDKKKQNNNEAEMQEALEKIVNSWILDYVFYVGKRLFDEENYLEFGEMRDIMQMVIQRPFKQTLEAMMKLRVLQLMSRLAEAQNLEAQFEDDSLTPMESALQVLTIMEDELKISQPLTKLKEKFKIQAVILCFIQNDYVKAAEVFKRQFGNSKTNKPLKDELQAALKNRSVPVSLLTTYPLSQIFECVNNLIEPLLSLQSLPFLLNASKKVLQARKEANKGPAADRPGTSSGTGSSGKVFVSCFEVRDSFVALNALGGGGDERVSLKLFQEMEGTDFLPENAAPSIAKPVTKTKKPQPTPLVAMAPPAAPPAAPSNPACPDTLLGNHPQDITTTTPHKGGGEKCKRGDHSSSSSTDDSISLMSLHKRILRRKHNALDSGSEHSDQHSPQIVKKLKLHNPFQVNGKNTTANAPHRSKQQKLATNKSLQSLSRSEGWLDCTSDASQNASLGTSVISADSSIAGRKKRQHWSVSETIWLKKGVKKYGTGNWAKILESYNFVGRSNVMLKDRWRTLVKLGEDKLDV